jgi:hypothetical protein
LAREKKRGEGGGAGLFIGARFLAGGGRVARGKAMDGGEVSGSGGTASRGRREVPTGGPRSSAGGGLGNVPLRVCPGMGHGPISRLGQIGPPGLFSIFLILFHFLNSDLIQFFCNFN